MKPRAFILLMSSLVSFVVSRAVSSVISMQTEPLLKGKRLLKSVRKGKRRVSLRVETVIFTLNLKLSPKTSLITTESCTDFVIIAVSSS